MSFQPNSTTEATPQLLKEVGTDEQPGESQKTVARRSTYGQILKSSVLIGGSSVLNNGIGMVRTKAMALLLGTSGVGLMGLYSSIAELTQSVAGMGINSSGVRQIAEAVGSGDAERIARTATVLRRISVLLGVLGGLLLLVFSRQFSTFTFGSTAHTGAVALLSVAVLFRCIAAGQAALVQGMRRIADLAAMGVWGALLGTVLSIPIVYFYREAGVVPALVGVAAMTIFTSWWYSRKIKIQRSLPLTASEVKVEAFSLLKLGFAFMASGLLIKGAAYAIQVIVAHKSGLDAAGLYQSAWKMGGLYIGFVLQAMGADFYPRLTAVSRDNEECNRLVNEQAHVSLLLAGPGVLATLAIAPLVLVLFYSTEFAGAVDVLRWFCLGLILQVIAWPMGYVVLAKGEQKIFFWTELASTAVQVGLAWFLVTTFGLVGAGAAFFGLYVWHGLLIYVVVRRLSGFRWSPANRRTGFFYLSLIAVVFCAFQVLPKWWATGLGTAATLLGCFYSTRALVSLVARDRIPPVLRRLLARFGW